MTSFGPDFIALQVHDIDAAAAFFEEHLGLERATVAPPGAIVFDTAPVSFAVRRPAPGIDPASAVPGPGHGVALWFPVEDADALYERMSAAGIETLRPVTDSPFGRTFAAVGPEGYLITVHTAAA